jgi:nucleotide-binding universal stress UspA family protein
MYKRILVAVDDSTLAEAALQEALGLAKAHSAQVRVVHAVESPYTYPESWYAEGREDLERLRQIWRQAGQRVLERADVVARQAGVRIESALLELDGHRVSEVIVGEATQWQADLVVAGTHGRRGVEHLFLGSVAEAIARKAPGSVLLVRAR